VWQSLMWCISRVLRERYGYRLINFCDEFAVACKVWQIPEVARVVMSCFSDHGLLACPRKCPPALKARRVAEVLGVGIEMGRQLGLSAAPGNKRYPPPKAATARRRREIFWVRVLL